MISYSDLYELLRKEKYSEPLQSLSKGFISDFSDFLRDSKDESPKEGGLFLDNMAKSKKQYENAIAIFKELMLRRKKKLLNLVFVAAETGIMKRDYENMLPFEKDIFDKLIKSFEDADKELFKMFSGQKEKPENKNTMIMFTQDVEQFIDMEGNPVGPFSSGELAHLDLAVANILVQSGKARIVDE